jgi:hypothetical protein
MGMAYEYKAWNMLDKAERDRYFDAIRRMRREYTETHKGIYDLTARPTVHYWAEEKYGFAMAMDGSGNYTAEYTVTNPKKFMLFKIKYWQ